jgi:hypothetical protein
MVRIVWKMCSGILWPVVGGDASSAGTIQAVHGCPHGGSLGDPGEFAVDHKPLAATWAGLSSLLILALLGALIFHPFPSVLFLFVHG